MVAWDCRLATAVDSRTALLWCDAWVTATVLELMRAITTVFAKPDSRAQAEEGRVGA